MHVVVALGSSVDGQLGVGKSDCNVRAALPLALPSADDSITCLSASLKHLIACTKGGVLLSAGSNTSDVLGREPKRASSLRPVAALSTLVIRSVAAGANFSFALSDSGRLFAWGANAHGQLGLGDALPRRRPRRVKFESSSVRVRAIAAGTRHALCLAASGAAYAWGAASQGQIGHATCVSSSRPVLLEVLRSVSPAAIAACGDHSIVRTASGRLYSWGSNAHGQLCIGNAVRMKHKCELVRCAASISAQHVSCGLQHTAVVSADGSVLTAGSNTRGQLGRAASEPRERNRLMAVQGLREHGKAIAVACGDYHTVVLVRTPEGRTKVLSFGLGSCGQLGHGKREGAAARPHAVTPRPLVLSAALLDTDAGVRRASRLWAGGNGSFVGISEAGSAAEDGAAAHGAGSAVTLSSLTALLGCVARAAAANAAGGVVAGAAADAAPLSDAALQRRAARSAEAEVHAVGAARLAIDRAYSSVSILNASFCAARYTDATAPLSRSRLVLADVRGAYGAIMGAGELHPKLLTTLKAASCRVAADLERLSSVRRLQRGGLASGAASQERPESLHAILIVLLNPLLQVGRLGSASSTIARNAISAFLRLPTGARVLFRTWWGELPHASFNAVVGHLVAFVNFSQSTGAVADIWGAATVLRELWVAHQTVRLDAAGAAGPAGTAAGAKRKREGSSARRDGGATAAAAAAVSFVCGGLRLTEADLKQDYETWITQRGTVHSFSAFAFLLNADIKVSASRLPLHCMRILLTI